MIALASGTGITAAYYPAMVFALLILPVAPVSIAVLLLTGIMRVVAPAHARTLGTVINLAVCMSLLVGSRLLAGTSSSLPELPNWLPTTWPGFFLAAAGAGDGQAALAYGLLASGFALGSFAIAVMAASRAFATGLASYGEVPRARKLGRRLSANNEAVPRSPVRTLILLKDLRSIRRDPARLVMYVYPLVIVGVNVAQLLTRKGTSSAVTEASTVILLLIASLLLTTTTSPAIVTGEGKALVVLVASPAVPLDVILPKWLLSWVPPAVLIECAMTGIGLYLGMTTLDIALLGLALFLYLVAQTGVSLSANLTWPKLDQLNSRRPSSVPAAITTILFGGAMGATVGVVMFLALFVWSGSRSAVAATLTLGCLICLSGLTFRLAVRQFSRLRRSGVFLMSIS